MTTLYARIDFVWSEKVMPLTPETIETLLTIGGTLSGVIAGSSGTLLAERLQRKYQDKTRYYDIRLEVYTEFLTLVGELITPMDEKNEVSRGNVMHAFFRSHRKTSLIASKAVRVAANALKDEVLLYLASSVEDRDTHLLRVVELERELDNVVRAELGVDKE